MSEENKAPKETQDNKDAKDNGLPFGELQWVLTAGGWTFIVLLLASIFWPNLSERTKFFTGNLFNLVIAFAVIAQVIIYKKQAEIMQRQFEVADRPWLAADVIATQPLTFSDKGVKLGFRISAKNVGRSVAVNAIIKTKMVIPAVGQNPWDITLAEQSKLCQRVRSKFKAYAVFPDGAFTANAGFELSSQDIERGRLGGDALKTDFFMMYLVGCVDYQFSGQGTHHQTGFIYGVYKQDPKNPKLMFPLEIGTDVPQEMIILEKMIMGGDYAN